MSVELSNDDRCVVDLLLERDGDSAGAGLCYSITSSATLQDRINHAERVLQLLENYHVGEPAPDLVARTLGRCAEESGTLRPSTSMGAMIARSSA